MIRIVCDVCHGECGTEEVAAWNKSEWVACPDCNGKGYTEHEGTLEDLELGLAVKWAIEEQVRFVRNAVDSTTTFMDLYDKAKLMSLYREQKGVE